MKSIIFRISFILFAIPQTLGQTTVVLQTSTQTGQTTDSVLYPYGPSEGDITNPKIDDGGSPLIPLRVPFPFFGASYRSCYVNNNGLISFNVSVAQYTPDAFPLADGRAFVAPFWADVDNRLYGNVYYRESSDPALLQRATTDVNRHFPDLHFTANGVFVATWDRVAYYGSSSTKENTFQAVLISNGAQSFIFLNYDIIQWTTGTASGGNSSTGLGGTPAQAGFNSGNSTHYFSIPGSRTPSILNIQSTSNVNNPGQWVFRTDLFTAVGGCVYKAQFLRTGDVFWEDSTCRSKCRCSENNTVICQNEGCSTYEQCQLSSWYYVCESIGSKTCSVSGDPHYYTFDGQLFHFQGTCTYVLSMLCPDRQNLTSYRIEVKNENRGNLMVSWTRLVRVIAYGNEITMTRDSTDQVLVNNIRSSLPVSIMSGKIRVYKSGFSITVLTDFGVVASYDGYHYVTVSVPLSYFNSTCGLCGTLTNDRSDDFLTSYGTLTHSDQEFAKSWRVPDNDTLCRDECNGLCLDCTPENRDLYSGNNYCGIITDPQGPFNTCISLLPSQDILQSCVYDLCATGGYMTSLCQALNSYTVRCQALGAPPQQWRRPGFCEITCPENSHYESCATACPASCADSTAPLYCNQPCRESCVCSNGYILSGGRCIPLNQCGCIYQGRYFSIGEEVILNEDCSTKCRCINANTGMQCQSYRCSTYEECKIMNGVRGCYPLQYGTCWVSGDPHYSTFDQRYFDFQGTCTYTLSKYCGISNRLTNFSISVTNENRGSTRVSWTRQVQLSIYNHQIKMSVGEYGRVEVDESVVNLPVLLESGAIHIYYTGSVATIEADFGLSLSYDWYHLVIVKLPVTYSGQLCGLCGNYNGNISDEFIMPNGSMAQNAISFGNSWINPNSSISCLATNDEPVCSAYSKSQYSSLNQCGMITNADGPFRACHSQVDGQAYFDNCIYDLCATNGDHTTLCEAIRHYALQCQRNGVAIEHWRNITRCELACPANSHYEICGSSCPSSCGNLAFSSSCQTPCTEVCQCDNGFVLSGNECVPLVQCGCTYNGVYYRAGETFWNGPNCEQKCYCNATTHTVQCSSSSCAPGEVCDVTDGVRSCRKLPDGVCSAAGDPHYITFDGHRYDFQGNCTYVLAELCNSTEAVDYFRVEAANENWAGLQVSVVAEVFIFVHNTWIQFQRGWPGTVKVNGIIVNLPVNLFNGQITIYQNGMYTVLQRSIGLTVAYDMSSVLSVTVSAVYKGRTCGLCGNFNGDTTDDFILPSGSRVNDVFLFASEWKTQDTSRAGCSNGCQNSCPVCSPELLTQATASCGIITDVHGPFALCHSAVNPNSYAQNCIYDVCLSGMSSAILCQSVQAYVGACQAANATVNNWRNETFCALQCPQNSHYEVCGDKCSNLCTPELTAGYCNTTCSEGCFCNDGFSQSGDACIPAEQCGCAYNGVYYKVGDVFWTDGCTQRCSCLSVNNLRCSPSSCNEDQICTIQHGKLGCQSTLTTCTIAGDPHYYTFDGAVAHFQGSCTYDIVKICNSSLDSAFTFSVRAENRKRGNPYVSFVSRVEIILQNNSFQTGIIIGASRIVQVNGSTVTLPVNVGALASISQLNDMVVLKADGVEISYDGFSTLIVRVGQQYKNSLCGMCGNFNDDPNDDKRLPNGTAARNDQQFGNGWKSATSITGCEDDSDNGFVCDNLPRNEILCEIITDRTGPFADCHWHVDPEPYYSSCVYDLCLYGIANGMLCTAVSSYQQVCEAHGVQIPIWQTMINCPLRNPCETQVCTDKEWCGEYYGQYGCYCSETFDNQTRSSYDYKIACSGNTSFVSLSRCLVFTDGFPLSALHLNDPICTGILQDGRLIFPFDSSKRTCGTKLQVNETHFIYSNAIQGTTRNTNNSVIIRERKINIAFRCEYPLSVNLSSTLSVKPIESVINASLSSGQGIYQAKMILFGDSRYSQPFTVTPVTLAVNTRIYVGIILTGIDPDQFVITLVSCWSTRTSDPTSSPKWDLIINRCPNPGDGTVIIDEDGVSTIARFSFAVFKFQGAATQFYTHCQIRLCNIQTSICTTNCLGARSADDGQGEPPQQISYGPIKKENSPDDGSSSSTGTSNGTSCNSVSIFILAILVLVSLLVFYKKD